MENIRNYIGLDTFTLKLLACLLMLTDHVGDVFFPEYYILRKIGRLAFPIFAFLVVEGFYHTHDVKKYMLRLFIFSLVSEVPFDLAFYHTPFYPEHNNVFFTLLFGLVILYFVQYIGNVYLSMGMALLLMSLAEYIHTDYRARGVLMILCFYFFRQRIWPLLLSIGGINVFLFSPVGGIQSCATLALLPIWLYNGKKGLSVKYIFYLFYPVHLLVIYYIWLMTQAG
ncbi:MAG: TraX family protein [Hespellia sp.]|nr:TraX family protein [Hespellia sp.]